jgi:hypothetical protein
LLAEADGSFQYQEYVVPSILDPGDDFGDLFGLSQRLVNGFSEFFHQFLEFLVHNAPRRPLCRHLIGWRARSQGFVIGVLSPAIVRPYTVKITVMSVSTVRKAGIAARVAARMASQRAGRNRYATAAWKALRVTGGTVSRVLAILWLEVTGFVFLVLAFIGCVAFSREYAKYQAGTVGPGKVILAICFTLLFAWFGVSSFWRARRRS